MRSIVYKSISILMISLFIALSAFPGRAFADPRMQPAPEKVVIVIDPGHGGTNEGANTYGPIEKNLTLITAQAMYAELSKYDNCTVYMTRTADVDMSLEERAQFAQNVGANFLFSLHYNASSDHKSYGAEVLIQKSTPLNNYGYQFGEIELSALAANGMFIRGVKTRNAVDGADYYGLLREAANRAIPAVIIEHCYLDYSSDLEKCNTIEEVQALGVLDATSVAKYFGLYSAATGTDYRSYASTSLINVPLGSSVAATLDEETPPDECTVTQVKADKETGEVTLAVHGRDEDDTILYYDYSLDGGNTYSEYFSWPGANAVFNQYDNDFEFTVKADPDREETVIVRAHNMFDRETESEPLKIDWTNGEGLPAEEEDQEKPGEIKPEEPADGIFSMINSYLPRTSSQDSHISAGGTEETQTASENPAFPQKKNNNKKTLALYILLFSVITGLVITGGLIYIFILMRRRRNNGSKKS